MLVHKNQLYLLRICADILALQIAFIIGILISPVHHKLPINVYEIAFGINLSFIWFVTARSTGLYDEFRSRNFSYELVRILKSVLIIALASIVIIFLFHQIKLARMFITVFTGNLAILITLERYFSKKILDYYRRKGKNSRNILIVGAGKVGWSFYETIRSNPHFGYRLIGFVDDKKHQYLNGEYLGPVNEINSILTNHKVDDVIIALPNYATQKIESVINICENYTTKVRIIPDYFKFVSDRYGVTMFGKFPVISMRNDSINEFHWRLLKRMFDTIFTVLLFILLFSWLWPIIIILQKMFNPGPVFYKAKRWGRGGKEFFCYKFRSMKPVCINCDENGNHQYTTKDDNRITPFGKFLRKTNLDELPQFINILKGEMSLVGPRPHDALENIAIRTKIKAYMWRHVSKPGLTGWAQVNGFRGGTSDIKLMTKRTEYDIWYIEHWSFWLDIQIIALTAWRMIKGDPNAY